MATRISPFSSPKKNSNLMRVTLIASLVFMGVTIYWSWFAPPGDYWPYIVGDLITLLPALIAAWMGTLLVRQFEPGEKPRTIWFWFAMGWWAWVAGEICGMGYDIFNLPYGDLSVYDIFWTAGYLFFGLSLFFQYRNIYSPQKKSGMLPYFMAVVVVLVATLGFTQWALAGGLGEGLSWFALYLAVFYPVCDLVAGITALWLAFLFGRGTWGRPWWGLIVFAIADGINIFLWIGGDRIIPEKLANFLDPLSGTIYNGGYVIALLGFLSILILNFWSASPVGERAAGPVA